MSTDKWSKWIDGQMSIDHFKKQTSICGGFWMKGQARREKLVTNQFPSLEALLCARTVVCTVEALQNSAAQISL